MAATPLEPTGVSNGTGLIPVAGYDGAAVLCHSGLHLDACRGRCSGANL
jgi:hypothetical protein